MGFDSVSDTQIVLGLSLNSSPSMVKPNTMGSTKGMTESMASFEPSLTLSLSGSCHDHKLLDRNKKLVVAEGGGTTDHGGLCRQDSTVISGGGSSLSNMSMKREREAGSEESERNYSNDNNYSRVVSTTSVDVEDDDGSINGRKKLRLTKPQSALLEEAFKLQSSLNTKQKQELARELKLRPRQVEVWFQNRRARTKLKQTEMDFDHLKKCYEMLTNENRRLHKELEELKVVKSFGMQLPAATLTMCPSCERIGDTKSKNPFTMEAKPHFFNSFVNSSAAC